MKSRLLFCLLMLPALSFGQSQSFPLSAYFGTNVFLHDNTNTPLHLRVPTNAVLTGVTSTNGSATITTNGTVVDIRVSALSQGGTVTNALVVTNGASVYPVFKASATPSTPGNVAAVIENLGQVGAHVALEINTALDSAGLIDAKSSSGGSQKGVFYLDARGTIRVSDGSTNLPPFLIISRTGIVSTVEISGPMNPTTGNAANMTNFPPSLQTVPAFNTWSTNAAKYETATFNATNLVILLGTNRFVLTGVLNP